MPVNANEMFHVPKNTFVPICLPCVLVCFPQMPMFSFVLYQVTLIEDGEYLCLDVPGLAKRKVEVVVGDKLIFSDPGEW